MDAQNTGNQEFPLRKEHVNTYAECPIIDIKHLLQCRADMLFKRAKIILELRSSLPDNLSDDVKQLILQSI